MYLLLKIIFKVRNVLSYLLKIYRDIFLNILYIFNNVN